MPSMVYGHDDRRSRNGQFRTAVVTFLAEQESPAVEKDGHRKKIVRRNRWIGHKDVQKLAMLIHARRE
jgi:hypothetical protein